MPRALVGNAGSERQVRRAARKETEYHDRLIANTRSVLDTLAGRALLWELLREARVYESVWHDDRGWRDRNIGQQDYGHFLLATCLEADEGLTQQMEREGRAWQRREELLTDQAAQQDEVDS